MKNTLKACLLLTIPVGLVSCAIQSHGLRAVSPRVVYTEPLTVRKSESLQPTLQWKDSATNNSSLTYDLVIYTGLLRESLYARGVEIYYREGIVGTSHRVEESLRPNMVYIWAVRTRTGTQTGPWSTYDFQRGYIPVNGLANVEGRNLWWRFKTPKQ